jgi:hypothetical protein
MQMTKKMLTINAFWGKNIQSITKGNAYETQVVNALKKWA